MCVGRWVGKWGGWYSVGWMDGYVYTRDWGGARDGCSVCMYVV